MSRLRTIELDHSQRHEDPLGIQRIAFCLGRHLIPNKIDDILFPPAEERTGMIRMGKNCQEFHSRLLPDRRRADLSKDLEKLSPSFGLKVMGVRFSAVIGNNPGVYCEDESFGFFSR